MGLVDTSGVTKANYDEVCAANTAIQSARSGLLPLFRNNAATSHLHDACTSGLERARREILEDEKLMRVASLQRRLSQLVATSKEISAEDSASTLSQAEKNVREANDVHSQAHALLMVPSEDLKPVNIVADELLRYTFDMFESVWGAKATSACAKVAELLLSNGGFELAEADALCAEFGITSTSDKTWLIASHDVCMSMVSLLDNLGISFSAGRAANTLDSWVLLAEYICTVITSVGSSAAVGEESIVAVMDKLASYAARVKLSPNKKYLSHAVFTDCFSVAVSSHFGDRLSAFAIAAVEDLHATMCTKSSLHYPA